MKTKPSNDEFVTFCVEHFSVWREDARALSAYMEPFDAHVNWRRHVDRLDPNLFYVCWRDQWVAGRKALGKPVSFGRWYDSRGKTKTPWNPALSAVARVPDPAPFPEECPCCGSGDIQFARHETIYNGRTFGDWPWVLLCTGCGAYVGLHPFTPIPLGTLAGPRLREFRQRCKAEFEPIYQERLLSRTEAYRRLASALGIPMSQCHFAMFDAETCERARRASIRLYDQLSRRSTA